MNELQKLMYNEGERLIPYVSHNEDELIRHRSSYVFFHQVIQADLKKSKNKSPLTIVDLGFGTGYGCTILSNLPNSQVVGVDISEECEKFARIYYPRSNIDYIIEDLISYIPKMNTFDYVVSRGVLEHVPDGLNVIKNIKFKERVMIDVPYDEIPGNDHHVLTAIKEDAFAHLENCELFYEALDGTIYDESTRPESANMIMAVISDPKLPKVSSLFKFPIPPVKTDDLENPGQGASNNNNDKFYFDKAEELLKAVEGVVLDTDVVADIGCGIAPMVYFQPKIHFMIDPWHEYTDILSHRHSDDKSIIVMRSTALEALRSFGDNAVDSIILLDVIEHMEKEEGVEVIKESERVARQQIIIFTPMGFMSQEMEVGDKDAWGLSGTVVQTHKSGWTPEDFSPGWLFYICDTFHKIDHKGNTLEEPHGAFYAIKNIKKKEVPVPKVLSDIRRFSEFELDAQKLVNEKNSLESENYQLKRQIAALNQSILVRSLRKLNVIKS